MKKKKIGPTHRVRDDYYDPADFEAVVVFVALVVVGASVWMLAHLGGYI